MTTRSYRNGVFFFQILYSSFTSRSSTCTHRQASAEARQTAARAQKAQAARLVGVVVLIGLPSAAAAHLAKAPRSARRRGEEGARRL